MLVKTPLAYIVRRKDCRYAVLTSLALCPTKLTASSPNSTVSRSFQTYQHSQRWFSSSPRSISETVPWRASAEGSQTENITIEEERSAEGSGRGENLPWYLQIKRPEQKIKSLSDRQRLPDLPLDPPPLLRPMLEHISIDLGLDDLSLIDLRELDPPPALGANLIMIIGTARGEKHLHVSADSFCRWLRSTHKLRPFANGLLGRGELRLKLKRKNRRTKMLNSVGASETSTSDDGIRLGWVCVNVGTIEDGRPNRKENITIKDDGYVGFGGDSHGARVVVQMLTEEKREELDLELLWGQALTRNKRRADRINVDQEQPPINVRIAGLDQEQTRLHSEMASATTN